MPYGYTGKILRVNLTDRKISVETPDEQFYRTYFGGRNLISYYLLKEVKPGVDPLGPENKLIFAAGALTGAPFAGAGRNAVGAKSPLTGGYGDAQGGGFFGAELKRAGWDAIIIEGQSAEPVYLWIKDDHVEIKDGSSIWGKTTLEAHEIMQEELAEKNIRTAQCGIGGEKLIRYAAICNDLKHFAGRTGLGAVMGSKKLRAIAVKGSKPVPLADSKAVAALSKWMGENYRNLAGGLYDQGTAGVLMPLQVSGGLPTRNFKQGQFEEAEQISGHTLRDTILVGRENCFACPIRCKRVVQAERPWSVDPKYGGPEYETIGSLGSVCGVSDLVAISKGHELCGAYSLDTISTGMTIAFAMECFENGILTKEDTGGIDLRFGNAQAMVDVIEKIAKREGIGDILAEGSKRAAERFGRGAEKYLVEVKGQELPMHEPRLKAALGIGYAVSPTGADHMHNIHDTSYEKSVGSTLRSLGFLAPLPADELSPAKARMMTLVTAWAYFQDCGVYCMFVPWDANQVVDLTRAVTGWNVSLFELMNIAYRSMNLPRIFNLREGFTAADDRLPDRIFEAFSSGPLAGKGYSRDKFEDVKKLHYRLMGWSDTGIPSEAKLIELGVEWAYGEIPESVR